MHLSTYITKQPAPATPAERRRRASRVRAVERAEGLLGLRINIASHAGWERQLDRFYAMTMADWSAFQTDPTPFLER